MDVWRFRLFLAANFFALGVAPVWSQYETPTARYANLKKAESVSPYVGHTPAKILPVQAERAVSPAPLSAGESTSGASTTPNAIAPPSSLNTASPSQSLLSETRQLSGSITRGDYVSGSSAAFRASTDAGNLLGKSTQAPGTTAQNRTPIVTDTRVRGSRTGQLLASGSYWVPARIDLDTILSKLDSRMIDSMRVIKGPYDVIYGPGFDFVDVKLLSSPRYGSEMELHGHSISEYKTNGQQLYGRQVILGGDDQWGFRVGYGHRTGNDYEDGSGTLLPSSYKSRDVDVALGFDLTENSNLEIHYLRLDQTDVEYPGQAFDLDFLKTDGIEAILTVNDQPWFDQLVFETWYNQTIFKGNAQGVGKRVQIPELDAIQLFARTEVYSRSSGFQAMGIWGDVECQHLRAGVDFRFLRQELNEPDGRALSGGILLTDQNGVVPRSHWSNPGLFVDLVTPVTDQLTVTTGGRLDFVSTDVDDEIQGNFGPFPLSNAVLLQLLVADSFETEFMLPAGHLTAAYQLDDVWTLTGALGTAGRTPNLTELYAFGPFLAILQQGFTSPIGDPNLNPERLYQADLRLDAQSERFRGSVSGFHAWIHDYITFEALARNDISPDGLVVKWVNTDWATLTGGEISGEIDVNSYTSFFGIMQYVRGQDLTRSEGGASRFLAPPDPNLPRGANSGVPGADSEPLPSIPPLESTLGIRVHDPCPKRQWTLEFSSRIVNNQSRVAASLFERPTAGFTTYDIRGSWNPQDWFVLVAGVENLTDKFYREHLDLRTGRGVYQPGINFYLGSELLY